MYQEDFLLRQLKDFVDGLAQIAEEDEAVQEDRIDDLLRNSLGISLHLLEVLPAGAIVELVCKGDAHDASRLEAVAAVLERLAAFGDERAGAKAHALRAIYSDREASPT